MSLLYHKGLNGGMLEPMVVIQYIFHPYSSIKELWINIQWPLGLWLFLVVVVASFI